MTVLPLSGEEDKGGAGCSTRGLFVGVWAGSGQCRFSGGVTGSAEDEVGGLGGRVLGAATE